MLCLICHCHIGCLLILFLILGLLQEVGCVATNWDMYDTYKSQENDQEGEVG